jgi:hypothetical protein
MLTTILIWSSGWNLITRTMINLRKASTFKRSRSNQNVYLRKEDSLRMVPGTKSHKLLTSHLSATNKKMLRAFYLHLGVLALFLNRGLLRASLSNLSRKLFRSQTQSRSSWRKKNSNCSNKCPDLKYSLKLYSHASSLSHSARPFGMTSTRENLSKK